MIVKYVLAFMLLSAVPCLALQPDEVLTDPVLEQRARELSKNLRCLVCQSESIDESTADFASDVRKVLRERLQAGDSDTQAVNYITDRYGDYILLNPPFHGASSLVWIFPAVLVVVGSIIFALTVKRK